MMQEAYIQARIAGDPPRKAARAAGYADSTKINDIERLGGQTFNKIQKAIRDHAGEMRQLFDRVLEGKAGTARVNRLIQITRLFGRVGERRLHG